MAEETKIQLFEPIRPKLAHPRPNLPEPYQITEAEEGPDLRAYWQIMQKRRWTILAILLVTFRIRFDRNH